MIPTSLRRDGHLSDLGLEAVLTRDQGALGSSDQAACTKHLETCDACQVRMQELRAHELATHVQAPPHVRAAAQALGRSPGLWWRAPWLPVMVGTAASVLLVWLQPWKPADTGTPGTDTWRVKGTSLAIDVHEKLGDTVRKLQPIDTVRAGARLGFAARIVDGAFLVVVGVDDRGSTYMVFPQHAARGEYVPPSGRSVDLSTAIELDAQGHHETIIAAACPDARLGSDARERAKQALDAAPQRPVVLWDDCAHVEYRLTKLPEGQ